MKNYAMSEQLFLDLWEKHGWKEELSNHEEIFNFLNELIQISNGQVIVDHFSRENYDYITRIEQKGKYLKIIWRDYNDLRVKYLAGNISDMDMLEWSVFNYSTYIYALLDVEKIKIRRWQNHTVVLFRTNLIEPKAAEHFLKQNNSEILVKNQQPQQLYTEFRFIEENREDAIIHDCTVYTLPFFTILIQPKEHDFPTVISHMILVRETLMEIRDRFDRVVTSLEHCSESDTDDIEAKGNTIRKLMEYALKYFCIYKKVPIKEIDQKYKYTYLGELRKSVIPFGITINQALIEEANKYSHDSGRTYHLKEVALFASQVDVLLKEIEKNISKEVVEKYPYLLKKDFLDHFIAF